jgi:hypothetical protein
MRIGQPPPPPASRLSSADCHLRLLLLMLIWTTTTQQDNRHTTLVEASRMAAVTTTNDLTPDSFDANGLNSNIPVVHRYPNAHKVRRRYYDVCTLKQIVLIYTLFYFGYIYVYINACIFKKSITTRSWKDTPYGMHLHCHYHMNI